MHISLLDYVWRLHLVARHDLTRQQGNAKHLKGDYQDPYSGFRPFAASRPLPIVLACQSIGPQREGRESGFAPAQLPVHYNKIHAQMTFGYFLSDMSVKKPCGDGVLAVGLRYRCT